MTTNPCADAERHENEQEARAEAIEHAQLTVGRALGSSDPAHWFRGCTVGAMYTPLFDIAQEAVMHDEECARRLVALLSSDAGRDFRDQAADWYGKTYASDVLGRRDDYWRG